MDKTKFVANPQLDSEGFVECRTVDLRQMFYDGSTVHVPNRPLTPSEKAFVASHDRLHAEASQGLHGVKVAAFTCSPWQLLDQDHLDRIHAIWQASCPEYQKQLAGWYYEAQTEARL